MMRRAVPFNYVQRGLITFWCGGLPRVLWVPSYQIFCFGLQWRSVVSFAALASAWR